MIGMKLENHWTVRVDSRVLVVNGAYEKDIILKEIRLARNLRATHLAITHFVKLIMLPNYGQFFENGLSPILFATDRM